MTTKRTVAIVCAPCLGQVGARFTWSAPSKNSGITPPRSVDQLASPLDTRILTSGRGAARRMVGSSRIALTSSNVIVGREPKPPRAPPPCVAPDHSSSRFVPIASNCCRSLTRAPLTDIHRDDCSDFR